MSGAKHTPGPWHVYHKANAAPSDLPWIAATGNRAVAFVTHESILKEDLARAEANASLIAAAPDLYEALSALQLQALQSSVNHAGNEWGLEALAMTKAALAKAEGRADA